MAKKRNDLKADFKVPAWCWRYLDALCDVTLRPTVKARCEAAGIAPSTLWRAQRRPGFRDWLEAECARVTALESQEIRTAVIRAAHRGDLEAVRIWLEAFEPKVRRQVTAGASARSSADPEATMRMLIEATEELSTLLGSEE